MKKKDKADLYLKTQEELVKMATDLGQEILKLRVEMSQGKLKNLNEAKNKIKDRARILTIARMKGVENA